MEVTREPSTIDELQKFYIGVFRPLYDRFINSGAVAQEIHAEMAAALDHLFCRVFSSPTSPSAEEIRKAAGHLKRATFDGFKLVFQNDIRKNYDKYMDNRYADVHDGKFRKEITQKWLAARAHADKARVLERESRGAYCESWHAAFDEWQNIIEIADYFCGLGADDTVIRARRKSSIQRVLSALGWLATLVLGAILSHLPIFSKLFSADS